MDCDVQICDAPGAVSALKYDELERFMLGQPQVEVQIKHQFAKGLYIREGVMPADSLFLGHDHKDEHHCVVLAGRMTLLKPNGKTVEISAPCSFVAGPGRKLVFIHEDVLMQNIHPTGDWPEQCFESISVMEEHLYRRSQAFKASKQIE